jgi:hypothetical protein
MSPTPEEIEADIERQREQLATTVDALSAKVDVKAHAKARVAAAKDSATTATGRPRPELVAAAGALLVATAGLVWWRVRH